MPCSTLPGIDEGDQQTILDRLRCV